MYEHICIYMVIYVYLIYVEYTKIMHMSVWICLNGRFESVEVVLGTSHDIAQVGMMLSMSAYVS